MIHKPRMTVPGWALFCQAICLILLTLGAQTLSARELPADKAAVAAAALAFAAHSSYAYDAPCAEPDNLSSGFCPFTHTLGKNTVVVFRGTDFDPVDLLTLRAGKDWDADLGQITGTYVVPYIQALEYTQKVESLYGPVIVTGHSLGGGMAQFVANALGRRAYCFNSAGLTTTKRVTEGIKKAELRIIEQRKFIDRLRDVKWAFGWQRANQQKAVDEGERHLESFILHLRHLEAFKTNLAEDKSTLITHLVANDDPVQAANMASGGRLLGKVVVYPSYTGHPMLPFFRYLQEVDARAKTRREIAAYAVLLGVPLNDAELDDWTAKIHRGGRIADERVIADLYARLHKKANAKVMAKAEAKAQNTIAKKALDQAADKATEKKQMIVIRDYRGPSHRWTAEPPNDKIKNADRRTATATAKKCTNPRTPKLCPEGYCAPSNWICEPP